MTCFKVKGNVDLLKLIQLGITLFDSGGQLPEGVCTWQVKLAPDQTFNLGSQWGALDFLKTLLSKLCWKILADYDFLFFSSISSSTLKLTCTQKSQYHYFR